MRKYNVFETGFAIFMFLFLGYLMVGVFIHGTDTARMWIYIILGFMVWDVLGCAVLAAIDTRGELLNWVKKAPSGFYTMLVVLLFPIVVIAYLYGRRKQ